MVTASRQALARRRTTALLSLSALTLLLPVSGCSSSASSSSGVPALTAAQAACQQVSAVLTDGPDPGADPVGYAEAQILPLRQISTTDTLVHQAISNLANAYSAYSASNGTSKPATTTLNIAISKINKICPSAGASL
jgi:hypothetical protein